jgi:hypothetical protein
VQRLGQPLDRDPLPDVPPPQEAREQRHAQSVCCSRMRSILRFVVRVPLAVVAAVVVLAIWLVAAPIAFVLGLAGWAAIRGTHEEKFVWGEAVLQRARALGEAIARLVWKM